MIAWLELLLRSEDANDCSSLHLGARCAGLPESGWSRGPIPV